MATTPDTDERREERANGTLGDLLYADRTKLRASEEDWQALVRSIAAGDQLALRALYRRTYRIVFTLAMRILDNRESAEEVTLDVFYDVWRRASGYDPAGGTVLGWIMNQARSRAIDRLRFEQRKKRVHSSGVDPLPAATGDDSERVVGLTEQRRALGAGLAVLTPPEREAIETAFFSDLTYSEVAKRLDQPLGTVKTRIRSGLAKLRRALAPETGDV